MEVMEPIGTIAIVCGSDSNDTNPLLTFILHLVSAIAYGNTVIMVPDEKTPIPALDLYEIFDTSDMPGGVVNILTGNKHHLTKYLCEHQQLSAIWYMNDVENGGGISNEELNAQKFVRYTSNFSLKQNWLISSKIQLDDGVVGISKNYLHELYLHSTQPKHIHIPMGTIFAN